MALYSISKAFILSATSSGRAVSLPPSEEQLTDVIEKEKEDDMSSEQIDRAFEKVDTLSMEEVKAYDSELDDFLRK